jgi:beta-N-acetylglucosaminidase
MPIPSSARLFQCLRCRRQVMICQLCDHGQRYCARGCRQHARKDSCKRARIKYQNSRKGRMNNALRQHRFRQRQKEKPKKVTHQTSLSIPVNDLLIGKPIANNKATKRQKRPKRHDHNVCHFCGRHCGDVFRVGFLKKRTTYPYRSKTTVGEVLNDP